MQSIPQVRPFSDSQVQPMEWEVFQTSLLELYHPTLRAKGTKTQMIGALRALTELGVKSSADINIALIARLVATRKPDLSPNTVKALLRCVQRIANFAVASGALRISPFAIQPLRAWVRGSKPKNKPHCTLEEVRRILDVLAKDVEERQGWPLYRARRLQALVALVAYTGLRRGEALYLQVQDLDLDAGVIEVVDRAAHRCKTERASQPVPIPPPLVPLLADYLTHRLDSPPDFVRPPSPWLFPNIAKSTTPWTNGPYGARPIDRIKAIGARAGVPHANFQALRRSVATMLEHFGAGPAMIQRILRHTNVQTSEMFYRKADLANMRNAVKDYRY